MAPINLDSVCYKISPEYFCSQLCKIIGDISWQIPSRLSNQNKESDAQKIVDLIFEQNYVTSKMGKGFLSVWQDKLKKFVNSKVADAVYQIIKLAKFDVGLSAVVGESLMSAAIISGDSQFIDMMLKFGYKDKYLVGGQLSALADVNKKRLALVNELVHAKDSNEKQLINEKLKLIDKGVDYIEELKRSFNISSLKLLSSRTNLSEYRRKFEEHKINQEVLQEFEETYQLRHKEGLSKVTANLQIDADVLDSLHGTLAKDMFLLLFGDQECLQPPSISMQ